MLKGSLLLSYDEQFGTISHLASVLKHQQIVLNLYLKAKVYKGKKIR